MDISGSITEMKNIPPLVKWQSDFVDRYLKTAKARSLLIAAPGTGKTHTALYTARQMLDRQLADAIFVITDRVALRNYWHDAAAPLSLDLETYLAGFQGAKDGLCLTIQSLRSASHKEFIDTVGRAQRWFIVIDDPISDLQSINSIVDNLINLNKGSKALFIARVKPKDYLFESEFQFDTEFIIDRSIIEKPETEIKVARFSPSFSLLRQIQKDGLQIDDLTWRAFEKLIATLLEKDGYDVELMKGTKDGGVDVVAVKSLGEAGYFKTVWQAKKKSPKNKVGISVIRELADTRLEFGASKGIIVTSTYLTNGALERVERDKYLLGKIDRDDLEAWIKRALFI